jgi:hypothetical protein
MYLQKLARLELVWLPWPSYAPLGPLMTRITTRALAMPQCALLVPLPCPALLVLWPCTMIAFGPLLLCLRLPRPAMPCLALPSGTPVGVTSLANIETENEKSLAFGHAGGHGTFANIEIEN